MSVEPMSPPGQAEVEAARLLLARLGLYPADLLAQAPVRPYIPVVSG
jgi:hypothetical protein